MPRDETFLLYILLSARRIESYVSGMTRAEFETELKTKDAVVMQIGVIGETAGKVSDEFRKSHPEINWHKMIGMRHRIFHKYHEVDWDMVWDAAMRDVPILIQQVAPHVPPDTP